MGRTRGKGGQRVAQQTCLGALVLRVTAMQMDELAELVNVLDRVHERRLPAGKQRAYEEKST